jgi:hypothetical protein
MLDIVSDLFNFLSFVFNLIYSWVSWLWDIFIGLFTGHTWVMIWHGCVAAGGSIISIFVGLLPGFDMSWLADHACEVNFFFPLDVFSGIVAIYLGSLPVLVAALILARWIKISS